MTRDPDLVYRILLAIEAKASTAPQPIKLPDANQQDVLNHLSSLHEEGLISRLPPRRSSSTSEVILVAVRDLTPAGRDLLAALKRDREIGSGASEGRLVGAEARAHAGEISVEANQTIQDFTQSATIELGKPPGRRRRQARTPIGRAVVRNQIPLALAAATFLALVDERLAELRQHHDQLNSADGKAITASQIQHYEDLKRRIEGFLEANAQFSAGSSEEGQIVEATTSVVRGVRNWWKRDHVSICNRAFDRITFGAALGVCLLAGAAPDLSVVTAGSLVIGKPFAETLRAYAKVLGGKE